MISPPQEQTQTQTNNPLSYPGSGSGSFLSLGSGSGSNNGGGWFSNFDWKIWLFLIFILAFLGINIFSYLAKGTQTITDLFAPFTQYFGGVIGNTAINTTKQIVNVSATGAKTGVDVAAGTVTTGLDIVQQTASNIKGKESSSSTQYNDSISQPTQFKDNNLSNTINTNTQQQYSSPDDTPTYNSDDSYSSIQKNKASGKSGFCYIGEDRGFRSCVEVGQNDSCMSGDIYPSMDICVNPTLRSG